MVAIRKKQYIYRWWVKKYWRRGSLARFDDLMDAAKSVDTAAHLFNDPGEMEKKTQILGRELDTLRRKYDEWLSQTY